MSYRRFAELERGAIDMKTGEFPAVLFTDGEASDGHILDIAGADVPARMPLFTNHRADPTMQLGSILSPTRTAHEVKVTGQIELDGDSALGDIRRDVALMMSRGHVSRMSGKWDAAPSDVQRRSELPRDHFAHSKNGGMYFQRWKALEGSIVGLGADPQAVAGRASDVALPDHVRSFWRNFSAEQEERGSDVSLADAIARLRSAGPSVLNSLIDFDPAGFALYEHEGRELLLPAGLVERLRSLDEEMIAGDGENVIRSVDPGSFSTQAEFMHACVAKEMDNGHPQDQAVAMCVSMWEKRSATHDAPERVAPEPAAEAAPQQDEGTRAALIELKSELERVYDQMLGEIRAQNREWLLRTFGSVIR